MSKYEYEVKFLIEKKISVEAEDGSEAESKALEVLKNLFGENIKSDIKDTNAFNVTQHKEWMKCIREEVRYAIYDIVDDMAEAHIECWSERYTCKSRSDIECELNVNYDFRSDMDVIENFIKNKFQDENFTLNKEEREFAEEKFIESILDNF